MNINATLLIQILVFLGLWWFTAKHVWPPIVNALDERSRKIADGLAAADKARTDLHAAEQRVAVELKSARDEAMGMRASAEKQGAELVEAARAEAARIVAEAKRAAEQEAGLAAQRARDQLRDQLGQLAVAGAERILRREIDPARHAELLANLKNELK